MSLSLASGVASARKSSTPASAAIAAAVWHHKAWLLPCGLGVTVAMFGTWGIADRELALHEHEEAGMAMSWKRAWICGLWALLVALASLAAWTLAIVTGRLTAYGFFR